jgi:hypothetical protein
LNRMLAHVWVEFDGQAIGAHDDITEIFNAGL